MLFNERGVAVSFKEHRMGDHVLQEADVGFHSPYPELLQGTIHDMGCLWEGESPGRDLNQQRVVVRGDFSTG